MAKVNPLQEQLLKAGLVKQSKVAAVAREQNKARHAKGTPQPSEIQLEAERARAEKVRRNRGQVHFPSRFWHAVETIATSAPAPHSAFGHLLPACGEKEKTSSVT